MPTPANSSLVVGHGGQPSDVNKFGQYPGNIDEKGSVIARPSQLADKTRLFDILKGWFRADATHSAQWRVESKEMYEFRAGEQWSTEDRQILNAQSRPDIVFNRVLTILKAVAGMEINGRHEIQYIPRHNEDTAVNELLSGAGKWMTDECDAMDEESAAFDDANTCGMGWTEHRLDYENDRSGMYIEERVNPREMYWDRTAQRKNLVDARRMARAKKIPLADAMQQWPGKTREQLDATWAVGTEMDSTAKTIEEKRKREENTTDTDYDDMYEVTVVNMQWFEREVYWLVADPSTNKVSELSQPEYEKFTARMKTLSGKADKPPQFSAVEMTRKIYKEAFLGGEILSVGAAPLGQFKWTCVTGEFNHTRGYWFGLLKLMMDPQRWANKWLSQSLHILNTTAKGGIVAESDAFEDIRDAEDKWARSDSIVWTKRGALSGDKPKIMPRPGGAMPTGHIQLMEFAISAIRDVTGINLELLGLKDQNQPGILEAQRKQAGMTVLATVFDSLRRFRKLGGKIRLHIIQNYLSDGRLIRIVGQDGAQALPLMRDKCFGEYDVVIDDAPASPNQKEANWIVMQQMLPMFKDQLSANPEILAMVMEYSPLPSKLVQALKNLIQQQAPAQQQQQNLAQAAMTAKTNKDQANAEFFLAQANKQASTAMYDEAIAEHQYKKTVGESELAHAKATHERVKAAVAAITPIPHPPNSDAEKQHERVMQASDQTHEHIQNKGQQRHEMLMQLLEQHHEKQMAQHEAAMAQLQQQHDERMGVLNAAMGAQTAHAGNQSKERVASAGNQSKERVAAAGNAAKERIGGRNNMSAERMNADNNDASQNVADSNNMSKENIAGANNQTKQSIAGMNNLSQMAQTAMGAQSPETNG